LFAWGTRGIVSAKMISGGRAVLYVANLKASQRFYIEILGMKVSELGANDCVMDAGEGFEFILRQSAQNALRTEIQLRTRGDLESILPIYENRGVVFQMRDEVATTHDPDGNVLRFVAGSV
jgi:catechol 2,3-dioxygenase-like lactoylglutathione lyase family enzyme